jgi:hypothetical protein
VILAVVIASLAAAVACVLLALRENMRRAAAVPGGGSPVAQFGALLVAVVLLALAGAVAIIDDKLPSGDSNRAVSLAPARTAVSGADAEADASRDETTFDYPISAGDLRGFERGGRGASEVLTAPLCLAQYYNRNAELGERSYKWWTTCDAAKRFKTIADVRAALALPPAWGARNGVTVACVPEGERVAYVYGRVAPVVNGGQRYRGMGVEYRLVHFDTDWIVSQRRLPADGRSFRRLDPSSCPA